MKWRCYECGKVMSLRQAESGECPRCGGGDIDIDNGSKKDCLD